MCSPSLVDHFALRDNPTGERVEETTDLEPAIDRALETWLRKG